MSNIYDPAAKAVELNTTFRGHTFSQGTIDAECCRLYERALREAYEAGLLRTPESAGRVDVPPPTNGKCDEVERFRAESPANNIRYLCEAIALAAVCDDDYEPHVQEILTALADAPEGAGAGDAL